MEKLLILVYKNRKLCLILKALSHTVSFLCVGMIAFILGYEIYLERYSDAAVIAASALVGFLLVSAARKLIDAPRPYELYSFYEEKPKEREGKSFPSRHAYSAFAIATLAFSVHIALGVAFAVLALLMCASRVLLGIHFIRDVVCGALIGFVAGGIGLLLI